MYITLSLVKLKASSTGRWGLPVLLAYSYIYRLTISNWGRQRRCASNLFWGHLFLTFYVYNNDHSRVFYLLLFLLFYLRMCLEGTFKGCCKFNRPVVSTSRLADTKYPLAPRDKCQHTDPERYSLTRDLSAESQESSLTHVAYLASHSI